MPSSSRLFRAPAEALEAQAQVVRQLDLSWNNWARGIFEVFTDARTILLSDLGRRRARSIPVCDVRALIICGDGPPYFLQRATGALEPVQSLSTSFARWDLRPYDFADQKLVEQHLAKEAK